MKPKAPRIYPAGLKLLAGEDDDFIFVFLAGESTKPSSASAISSVRGDLRFSKSSFTSFRDYGSPWISVQSRQNTLNMCFTLLNYPGGLDTFLENELAEPHTIILYQGVAFKTIIKNENMEVGITPFVL